MATKFLETGGDATFNVASKTAGGFYDVISGSPVVSTDFVHGSHIKSLGFTATGNKYVQIGALGGALIADTGGRFSFYVYIVTAAAGATLAYLASFNDGSSNRVFELSIASNMILKVDKNNGSGFIGTGSTLNTGTWYRISIAWKITSTTVNRIEVFVNGVSDISITNTTFSSIGTDNILFGNSGNDSAFDCRGSDIYVDDSNALTDPGNIWVTAKRPNANGTTNGYATRIGAGGSGYGTGHSPQVNERALSATNGWSMIGAGSAITEEYNIESKSVGDIDITTATIVDYVGWLYSDSTLADTAQIIVNNVATNISLTGATKMFTKAAGSSTYPAGTGTDIGEITSTTLTTVSLYECGIMVAYTPAVASSSSHLLSMMGVGT